MPLTDPVPSSSFDVLERNVQDTDKFVNQETGTFTNRVGKIIKPIPVIEAEANAAVISIGWTPAGDFATGFTYTKLNDVGRDALGSWWRYSGSDLPKVIIAGTVPSSPNFSVISFETADNVSKNGGGSVQDFIDKTTEETAVIMPNVDTTGVVDESAKILALLNDGYSVKLPSGKVKLKITLPDGAVLLGSGAPRFNDTVLDDWDAFGTVIIGNINVSNRKSWTVANLSIDNFGTGNAFAGIGPKTGYGFCSRVNSRASDHGFLFETATSYPLAGRDPASDVVGNIVVQDCEHWGGPNGYVTKHHRVSYIRCKTYGVTVQGFVAVSDNINAATSYNRATDTLFEDCYSEGEGLAVGGSEGVRIYTHDRFSEDNDNDVNTNGVHPADNTHIRNFTYANLSGVPIRIGDYEGQPVAALQSHNNYISFRHANFAFNGVALQHSRNTVVHNSVFGFGSNVSVTNRASNVIFGDGNYIADSGASGAETGMVIVSNGSTSFGMRYWVEGLTYIYRNTVATEITTVSSSIRGKVVRFILNDEFTTLGFLFAVKYKGKGTIVDAMFDGASWIAVNVSSNRSENSTDVTFNANLNIDYSAINYNNARTFVTGNLTTVTLAASKLSVGSSVGLLLQNTEATVRSISGWSSNIMFASAAPTELTGFRKLLIKFDVRGTLLIETSRTYYT